ncbi:MAG: acyl-CoA thioesterase [Marinobacterium sp.]|nr:acyl-CoA thioesterase [Marinobacterium sp.]
MSQSDELIMEPQGRLTLQRPALNDATNLFGDVYGGWVSSQLVMAAEMRAAELAQGRIATVSVGSIQFMSPVLVGTVMSFYTRVVDLGHSSGRIHVEAWGRCPNGQDMRKVTEAEVVLVAIDQSGHIRRLPRDDD